MAICVTVYNETRDQLERTLDGLIKGITYFQQVKIKAHEIVVVVIFDGMDKLNNDESNERSMLKKFQYYDIICDLA